MNKIQPLSTKPGSLFENKKLEFPDLSISEEEYAFLEAKMNQNLAFNKLFNSPSKKFTPHLNSSIISFVFRSQLEHAKRVIEPSFMSILFDTEGVVACISCSEDVAEKIDESEITIGTSLSLKYAGINAQSAAMELQRPVFMRYKQHTLPSLWDWACICIPIVDKSNILIGYIDISAYCSVAVQQYYHLFLHISKAIGNYQTLESHISSKLDDLPLTKRQKEVCWYWIHDYDYKAIGRQLFISPNTVRVIVSQINEILSVSSKLSMLLTVLDGYAL